MLFRAFLSHFIAFGLLCPIRAPLSHYILLSILGPFHHFRAPLSHFILLGILGPFHHFWAPFVPFGLLWPICFPLGILGLLLFLGFHDPFSNFVLPWAFTNFIGLPRPNYLILILGAYGLAINPLLSLFSLLWAYCGAFLLFHIIYCPWFAFSLFPGSQRPIYLFKTHFFFS